MHLPPNACIFTYDAISMYTNIETEDCINRLSEYLLNPITLKAYPYLTPPLPSWKLSIPLPYSPCYHGSSLISYAEQPYAIQQYCRQTTQRHCDGNVPSPINRQPLRVYLQKTTPTAGQSKPPLLPPTVH